MGATRCIVVGVDGSPSAARALRWALDAAAELRAEVVAVHALGLLAHGGASLAPSQAQRDEVRRLFEEQWCAALAAGDVAHRRLLVDGNPVTALLRTAGEVGADLVVVGSRGTGGFPGLQLGSSSLQLVQHSPVPVVVVPADPAEVTGTAR